jgi:hypothetical protein
MSTNTLNSGSLQVLQVNETLLVSARKVAGQKIQLEFAEIISKEGSKAVNPLAVFNKSDDRFSQGGGARRAWMTVEPDDASEYLGIDFSAKNKGWKLDAMKRSVMMLNVLNPVATIGDEEIALKVEIIETTQPNDYQVDNIETSAKRKGKDGAYCTHNGLYIFANTRIAFNKANHVFLEMDRVESTNAGIPAGISASTGEIFN